MPTWLTPIAWRKLVKHVNGIYGDGMNKKVFARDELDEIVAVIVGTRPGIVMFAPIIRELRESGLAFLVIHTGQHYSPNMDAQFFKDLSISQPDYRLQGVAERPSHGGQTAAMLEGIETILMKERPRLVMVGGDANTNLAGALAARKLGIGVAHVEAGERSFDWRMPEEHNRRMIDHISDLLFVSGPKGATNLRREFVQGRIIETGNPIVDASVQHAEIARQRSDIKARLGLEGKQYAVLTMHREENVDFVERLRGALSGVSAAGEALNLSVVFLVHPRTYKRLREFGLLDWAEQLSGLRLVEAAGYLDFIRLLTDSEIVFTDSGGVQQEACIHHVPCVTLRENTEWTETLELGANRLAGTDRGRIVEAAMVAFGSKSEWPIPFGDGHASEKIAKASRVYLAESREEKMS